MPPANRKKRAPPIESPGEPPTLLTSAEVAKLLRVHPKHVYRLLREGLPARRVGSEWRFVRHDVLEWSNRGGPMPRGEATTRRDEAPRTLGEAPPLLAANGDVAIELLLAMLLERSETPLGFVQADRDTALELLARRRVIGAGTHGVTPPTDLAGERLVQVHLVHRDIGLVWRKGSKRRSLEHLGKPGKPDNVRLASRPPTAGVRVHLDAALRAAGHDPAEVQRHASMLASHREVACAVLREEADLGIASSAWAARVGLGFTKLATEPYGITLFAQDLGDPRVTRMCEVAQSLALRKRLEETAGYDARDSGNIRYEPV